MAPNAPSAAPEETLSVLDGIAMMVGIIVGVGIFKTPALVAMNAPSDAAVLGLWILGGAAALIGALVYAELGSAYPSTGGEYEYLRRSFGAPLAILFAWARMAVIQTGAIAAVAYVFGDYASELFSLGRYGKAVYAALAIAVFTLVNLAGATPSHRAQSLFTAATVLAITIVVVLGFAGGRAAPAPPPAPNPGGEGWQLAMIFVLLTYGGWNEAAYLSAELRDVRRNMLRVLVLSIAAVVLIYVMVNMALLYGLGIDALRTSQAAMTELMRRVVGETGATLMSVVVSLAALSTLNGTIFTGARVYHAVGRDVPALRVLGFWDPAGQKPTYALVVQGAIAMALVAFGAISRDGFQAIVEYTAPVFWLFLLLVGIGSFRIRRSVRPAAGSFRVPLYPLTPTLFCLTCAFLLYASLTYTGLAALLGVAVLASGAPLLLLNRSAERARHEA